MTQAAIETVWRAARRVRINQFPISDNLSALTALVMADLSESQRETLTNLIYQRDIEEGGKEGGTPDPSTQVLGFGSQKKINN